MKAKPPSPASRSLPHLPAASARREGTPDALRLGRIGYLNVLPVYHALECGALAHDYELVYGPPSDLNTFMAQGTLLASATSSIEYARRPARYLLLRDLAIVSNGQVQSVLLLSRLPLERLDGRRVLVSPATHTSIALLRLLFADQYPLTVSWQTGVIAHCLESADPPDAFLAIGDEALRLRRHPAYPHCLDLGEAWRRWTGLPFVFGLWVADRSLCGAHPEAHPGALLNRSRDWGLAHFPSVLDAAEASAPHISRAEHDAYFQGLSYSLGEREQQGLLLFWEKLAQAGVIAAIPPLHFL